MSEHDRDDKKVWRPPTRRAFVAMIGAAAAALAVRERQGPAEPESGTSGRPIRWIGHF